MLKNIFSTFIFPIKLIIRSIDHGLPGWGIPIFFVLFGAALSTQLRNIPEALLFFLSSIILFITYVFGSRMRQRGSLYWIALAGIGANGMWYVTMHILDVGKTYWLLFSLYTIGIVAGRTIGVKFAQYIEKVFKLKADATRDERLASSQRYKILTNNHAAHILLSMIVGYTIYGFARQDYSIHIVLILGFFQNSTYALATRAGNRNSNVYIAITGILSGIPFYLGATYLFSMNMPLFLFIPYVVSTTLGSIVGSFISMLIEYEKKLQPDAHITDKNKEKNKTYPVYLSLAALAVIWLIIQEPIFKYFDLSLAHLKFPLSFVTAEVPRLLILLTAASIFFAQEALHSLTSRSGNRDHQGYHLATLVPKGLVDFFKLSYISINDSIPEIIPLAVLSSSMGSIYGKNIGKKIEKWLKARMDVENESKQKTIVSG